MDQAGTLIDVGGGGWTSVYFVERAEKFARPASPSIRDGGSLIAGDALDEPIKAHVRYAASPVEVNEYVSLQKRRLSGQC
jgi:hypothetical protein